MSCQELRELYELYALGALEAPEHREIDEHLARNCPQCAAGVKRAGLLAASLAFSAPAVEPPGRLKKRVVASVTPAAPKAAWLIFAWATAAAVLLAAALWYGAAARRLETQLTQVRTLHGELEARNRLFVDALALVNLPDARQLVFGGADPLPPRGRIWVHPQRGVLLLAARLPAAPAGKIYEMWIVPKAAGAKPRPAGLFQSSQAGEATHVWAEPLDLAGTAAIAVTLEPEGGAPEPTSTPIIVAAAGL